MRQLLRGMIVLPILLSFSLAASPAVVSAQATTFNGGAELMDHVDCDLTPHRPALQRIGPVHTYANARAEISCDTAGVIYLRVELERSGNVIAENDLWRQSRFNEVTAQKQITGTGCQSYRTKAYAHQEIDGVWHWVHPGTGVSSGEVTICV